MTLPELFKQRTLSGTPIRATKQPRKRDLALGRDALARLGAILDFDDLAAARGGKIAPACVPPARSTPSG